MCCSTLSDARDLVHHTGKIHLCESEATFQRTEYARGLQRANGVEFSVLGPADVNQLAPALTRKIARGVYYPNPGHCILPLSMITRFTEAFVALGGDVVREEIRDIEIGPNGPTALIGATRTHPVERMVLAAGIGSGRLAKRLGAQVPMIAHRGYNATLPVPADTLRLPVKSEDRNILLTPMQNGIRVTGIAEIADPALPPTPGLVDRIVKHARAVLPEVNANPVEPWMGSRPCTPDSLPVIGPSPRFRSAVLAFGHGHLGLGLGAISGRVVSELLTEGLLFGRPDAVPPGSLSPFALVRRAGALIVARSESATSNAATWRRDSSVPRGRRVRIEVGGKSIEAFEGESLAIALAVNGHLTLRHSPGLGAPRGMFCLMGVCQECVVLVDGEAVPSCMEPVRDAMRVSLDPLAADTPAKGGA